MSKYEVKLSYAKPNKYQKLLETNKGINPKKLKASLSIIMPSEGKVELWILNYVKNQQVTLV